MAGVNKVILIGNLGRDPEIRYTQGGTAVANFTLATTDRFKNRDGEWEDRTEWHRVVFFGRTAEVCGEYLHKGKQVYVEGRLQTRKWEDKGGQERYTTEIVGDRMQMLGRADGGASGGRGGSDQEGRGRRDQGGRGSQGVSEPPIGPDDDIPF